MVSELIIYSSDTSLSGEQRVTGHYAILQMRI